MNNDTKKEYVIVCGLKGFNVLLKNKMNPKRKVIFYEELDFPSFVYEESIMKEIKEKVAKFFKVKEYDIILRTGTAERNKISEIIKKNKLEYDHFDME